MKIKVKVPHYSLIFIMINRFKKYDSSKIKFQVSLDGLQVYHDKFRGVKGCYSKTEKFIEQIVNMGFNVTIGTCLHTQDYEEIKELCEVVKKIGVSSIRLGTISEQGRAVENNILHNIEQVTKLRNFQQRLSSEEDNDNFKVRFLEDVHIMKSEYGYNCGMGQIVLKISSTGNVSPCLMSNIILGNINDTTLENIQKKYSRVLEKVNSPCTSACEHCEKKILCENCIVEGIIHCDNKDKSNWINCEPELFQIIREQPTSNKY